MLISGGKYLTNRFSKLECSFVSIVQNEWLHVLFVVTRNGFLVELTVHRKVMERLINIAMVVADSRSQKEVAICGFGQGKHMGLHID